MHSNDSCSMMQMPKKPFQSSSIWYHDATRASTVLLFLSEAHREHAQIRFLPAKIADFLLALCKIIQLIYTFQMSADQMEYTRVINRVLFSH